MNMRIFVPSFRAPNLIDTAVTAGYVYGLRDGLLIGAVQQNIGESMWIESDELDFERWYESGAVPNIFEGKWVMSVSGEAASFVPHGFVKTAEVTTVPVDAGIQFVQASPSQFSGTDADAELFAQKLAEWREDTEFQSSMEAKIIHPAYQRIIGMGQRAIPLILRELRNDPDWFFWALESITGEAPAAESARGSLEQLTTAWLRWGEDNGFGETEML